MLHPRYISLRCQYKLSVRLLVLLFLVHSIASACTTDPAADEQADAPEERPHAAAPDTAHSGPAEPAVVHLLGNPFVASRSQGNRLSTYFDRINTDFTVDADPIENRHQASVTDTLYTIRFEDSMLEFYAPSQTGDLLLQVADIRSANITLRDNLRVGMDQAELLNCLKGQLEAIRITQTPGEVIASTGEGAPASLHFYLRKGKVNRIRYEGYVD